MVLPMRLDSSFFTMSGYFVLVCIFTYRGLKNMVLPMRLDSSFFTMSGYFVLVCIFTYSVWMKAEAREAPITDYRRGYSGRVDYVKAVISKENLDSGTRPSETSILFFRKLVANGKNDVPGQLIPRRLGGTGTETYNIAPMNERTRTAFYKKRVEDPIYVAVSGGSQVEVEVWPRYEGSEATRPNRFDVSALRKDGTPVVDKITIVNPTS